MTTHSLQDSADWFRIMMEVMLSTCAVPACGNSPQDPDIVRYALLYGEVDCGHETLYSLLVNKYKSWCYLSRVIHLIKPYCHLPKDSL